LAKAIQGGWEYGQAQNQYNQITQNDADTRKQFLAAALAKTGGGSADPSAAGTPPAAPANGDNPGSMMGGILGVGQGLWNGGQSLWNGLTGGGQSGAPAQPAPPQAPPASNGTVSPQPDTNQPLSVRNNNPGNLVDNAWTQSLPGYKGANGRFAVFDSPQSGGAAMASNLTSYAHHGVDTLLGLTSRWAPSGDGSNNPALYAKTISDATGIPVDAKIDLTDPATVNKIMPVMAAVERGGSGGSMVSTGGQGAGGMPSPSAPNPNKDLMASSLRVLMDPLATPGMIESAKMVLSSQMPTPKEFKTIQDASGQQTGVAFDPRTGTATPIQPNGMAPRLDLTVQPQGGMNPPQGSAPSPTGNIMPASSPVANPPATPGGTPLPQSSMTSSAIPPGMVQSQARLQQLVAQNNAYLSSRADGPQIVQLATMMLRGQIPYPQGTALKDPTMKAATDLVGAADPQFNGSLYDSIKKARESFQDSASASTPGGQVLSVRTLMGQLKDLAVSSENLGKYEGNSPIINGVRNYLNDRLDNQGAAFQAYTDFKNKSGGLLGTELVKFMSGSAGSEADREEMSNLVDPNASVTTRRTALNAISNVLQNKAGALQKMSDAGANSAQNPNQVIDPGTQQHIDFIKGLQDPQFLQAYHSGTLTQGPDGRWRMPAPGMPGRFMVWNGGQ
jgi:hypothetical protein